MGRTLINLFTRNYWWFCQNSCFWNIYFENNPKESVVETFKNISKVGVHCWCIKDTFAWFCQQIFKKITHMWIKLLMNFEKSEFWKLKKNC